MNRLSLLVSLLAISASACASHDGAGTSESVGQTESTIIGGTVVDPNGTGFVKLEGPLGLCSGTLLSNKVVLTAKHCVQKDNVSAPVEASSITLTMGTQVLHGARGSDSPWG